ncbi:MAG: HAD hydrolase-like protein [Planctomycetota bacterium]|nr:HAD hydrolase-like protein [Planctomycetota bacterium]
MDTLLVFDIDGTLTESMGVDTELFVRAAEEVLGVDTIDTDWSSYTHRTDTGVTRELVQRKLARAPTPDDVDAVRARFITLLRGELFEHPHRCRPIPGALEMLAAVDARADVACAVATGGWRESALLKVDAAGLPIRHLPFATSDDAHERTTIMRTAVERARGQYDVARAARTIYVGDAVWDVEASHAMGIDFVGISGGERDEHLRTAGAQHVIPDFTDLDAFLAAAGL